MVLTHLGSGVSAPGSWYWAGNFTSAFFTFPFCEVVLLRVPCAWELCNEMIHSLEQCLALGDGPSNVTCYLPLAQNGMTSTTLGEIDPRVWKDFGFECIYPFTLSLKTLCQAVCIHLLLWHQRPDPDASNLCSCRGGRNCSHERMLGVMCLMEKNQEQKETVTLERRNTQRERANKRKDDKYIFSP